MRREGTKDRPNKNHLLAGIIQNGQIFPLLQSSKSTNLTTYAVVSNVIIDVDLIKKSKVKDMRLVARSASVGGGGLSVQLFDNDAAAEVGVVSFLGSEDQTIKSASVKSYLSGLTGRAFFTLRIKKDGPTGPSTVRSVALECYGKLSGTKGE